MNIKCIFIFFAFVFSLNFSYSVYNVTGGFNISFELNTNTTYSSNPVSFSNINYVKPYLTDINTNQVNYSIGHTSNLYDTKIIITQQNGVGSSLLCQGNLASLDIQNDCLINYDNTIITDTKIFYGYVCNEYMQCSLGYPFTFMLNEESEAITGGFMLTMTSDINITDLVISTPNYVYPTPTNNMKKTHITNIIINVSDSNTQIESCRVVIDGDSYPMTYLNNHCNSTYTLPINNGSIQTYNFQVFYTESGIEHSLNQRTFYIYPNLDNQSKFPAFGFTSLIISLLILFVGFLFN